MSGNEVFLETIDYLRKLGMAFEDEEESYNDEKYWILEGDSSIHVRMGYYKLYCTESDGVRIENNTALKHTPNEDKDPVRPYGFLKIGREDFIDAVICLLQNDKNVNTQKEEYKRLFEYMRFAKKYSSLLSNENFDNGISDSALASELGALSKKYGNGDKEQKELLYEIWHYRENINIPDNVKMSKKYNKKPKALDDSHSDEEKTAHAKSLTIDELENIAVQQKTSKPKTYLTEVSQIRRNPYVSEYAKKRAKGICQLCGNPAPFSKADGEPYLESHHIVWLSKGGEDSPANSVALCPNCHRKMHVLNDPLDVQMLMDRNKNL
jgi:5-methylcytosine-specific restriction endonuclease McrA